jgi:hypothetical protein
LLINAQNVTPKNYDWIHLYQPLLEHIYHIIQCFLDMQTGDVTAYHPIFFLLLPLLTLWKFQHSMVPCIMLKLKYCFLNLTKHAEFTKSLKNFLWF